MREEVREAGFLYMDDFATAVLLAQVVHVDNAGHRGSDEPRKSKQTIDHVGKTVQEQVPVVGITVLQVVARVVDQDAK